MSVMDALGAYASAQKDLYQQVRENTDRGTEAARSLGASNASKIDKGRSDQDAKGASIKNLEIQKTIAYLETGVALGSAAADFTANLSTGRNAQGAQQSAGKSVFDFAQKVGEIIAKAIADNHVREKELARETKLGAESQNDAGQLQGL